MVIARHKCHLGVHPLISICAMESIDPLPWIRKAQLCYAAQGGSYEMELFVKSLSIVKDHEFIKARDGCHPLRMDWSVDLRNGVLLCLLRSDVGTAN